MLKTTRICKLMTGMEAIMITKGRMNENGHIDLIMTLLDTKLPKEQNR